MRITRDHASEEETKAGSTAPPSAWVLNTSRQAARSTAAVANALSRHGAIAANRTRPPEATRISVSRAASLLTGSTFIGLGVSFFVHARLGLAPYDVLLSALSPRIGLSLGQSAWVMAAVLFSVAALLGQRPRLSGLAYVAANGFAVDIAVSVIRDAEPLGLRILFAFLGLAAIVGGISLVVHSGLTGGAFELLMNAGRERGRDPIKVRTGLELSILAAGIALGGDFGIATIGFAALVGPTMRAFNQALSDHRNGRALRKAA
jgi:uncharacterized membrane protein YczE